jgi:hypothetical protein
MKKILAIATLMAMLTGCTSSTQYGSCIGVADDKEPHLQYKLSVWNTFLAIIFSETIVVPIVVLANETYCPVGVKAQPTTAAEIPAK